ncbi:MAG TPA: aldehyde dehydrogenase family protein, partial [Limnochordia bacterium]
MSATTSVKAYGNLIGGEWVSAAETVPDINPAHTDQVLGLFPRSDASAVEAAIAAAADAFPRWRAMPMPARGAILYKAADLLEARLDEVARALTQEEGKTFAESRGETARGVSILRYFAAEAMQPVGEVYPSASASTFLYTTRQPLGVVGLITPWNFPVAIPLWKLAPALVYGNTVVLKPAELTPLTAWLIAETLQQAGLPPGVLNVVFGRGSVIGDVLVNSPRVAAISFTGSNAVGRRIHDAATARGAKVQCEMGGKNPVIVMPDADLDQAVELTISGAMRSTGQKCTATSRAIVFAELAAAFTERLIERARSIRVGDGMDPETYMGPLVSEEQRRTVLDYIQIGQSEGARLAWGGQALEDGPYREGY